MIRTGFSLVLGLSLAACGAENSATDVRSADPDALLPSGMTAREVAEARALHMKDLGGSFKSVRDQLKTDEPNLTLVRIAAQEVQYASADLPSWFPAGTGPEIGIEMQARPNVWTDAERFAQLAEEFRQAAGGLSSAAQGSDLVAMREGAGRVGGTCKGCHDDYRTEDD